MKNYKFTIRGNTYDVEIKNVEDNIARIEVNGTPYDVEIHREIKKQKTPTLIRKVIKEHAEDIKKQEKGSPTPVVAPLPGVIREILVSEGDIIKKDQKMLIMEAMKMENNVLSERDGVIEKISVQKGDSVLQGDILLEIV